MTYIITTDLATLLRINTDPRYLPPGQGTAEIADVAVNNAGGLWAACVTPAGMLFQDSLDSSDLAWLQAQTIATALDDTWYHPDPAKGEPVLTLL